MPHTTYGLLKAIRSHQIDSPSVGATLQTGRPNACNLCHLDQSLGWAAQHLAKWYGQPETEVGPDDEASISAAVLWALKGDAGQRALMAWHMGWEPARQASGEKWLAPFLSLLLEDPYSAVRYIAHRSLKRLPGYSDFAFDFTAATSEQARGREQALARWNRTLAGNLDRRGKRILIAPDGTLQQEQVARLRQQRDDRSIDLQE
jgi:hypothetical protein